MQIVKTLTNITGGGNAFAAGEERAQAYHDLFADLQGVNSSFEAVVRPGDRNELQAVVKAVHEAGMNLWCTPNAAGNGAVINRRDGPAVLVDQQRMNRILEINDFSACALVEPGVSYRQLYDHLRKNDIDLWIDPDHDPDHSIAGSICARHYGYTPYGDHALMQCGMEVVLADGELLRTGMGALPGSDTWQLSKYNFGPYIDGLFMQSDLALVSKMGLWLMPPPPAYRPFMVTLPSARALGETVEALRDLKLTNTIPNTVAISNMAFETSLHFAAGEIGDAAALRPEVIKMASGLGHWNVFAALYGGPDNVELIREAVSAMLHRIDGAVVFSGDERDDPVWNRRRELMRGRPVDIAAESDGRRSLRLTAAAPIEDSAALRMHEIAERVTSENGVDYLCEYAIPSRTLFKQIILPYQADDAASRQRAVVAVRQLVTELDRAGYGIVAESLQLRRMLDEHYSGSAMDDLVGRIRAAVRTA